MELFWKRRFTGIRRLQRLERGSWGRFLRMFRLAGQAEHQLHVSMQGASFAIRSQSVEWLHLFGNRLWLVSDKRGPVASDGRSRDGKSQRGGR